MIYPNRQAGPSIEVSFKELLGRPLDVAVYDGTVPGREDPQNWINFLQVAGGIPQMVQSLDFPRLALHLMRQLGAKNASNFILQGGVQALPNEQAAQQIQAGNIVPLEA
jgi:hypothetical protein